MNFVFKNGDLIDGTGKMVKDAVVVVHGDTILASGPSTEIHIPEGENQYIDAQGMTILPGLIDLHVHLHGQGEAQEHVRDRLLSETDAYQAVILSENARRTLEAGFTTIRDMGAPKDINIDLSRSVMDGILPGPRIIPVATIGMTRLPGDYDVHGTRGAVTGAIEARKMAREKIAAGAEVVHVKATGAAYGQLGPLVLDLSVEEMQAAIEETHKLEKLSTAHACGAEGMKNAVIAGTMCIEHGQWLYDDDELIRMMVDRQIGWVPTLMNNPAKMDKMREAETRGERSGLAEYVEKRISAMIEAHRRSYETAMENGVMVALGSDCGAPFTPNGTNAKEMEMFVKYGATEMQAIEAGTRLAARVLQMEDRLGTVEDGKEADIIVMSKNPLKDILYLQKKENIVLIMKGGKIMIDRRKKS